MGRIGRMGPIGLICPIRPRSDNRTPPVTIQGNSPQKLRITTFQAPGGTGVRVDSAAYADAVIPPFYDSMIAKLVVKGRDRSEAIGRSL